MYFLRLTARKDSRPTILEYVLVTILAMTAFAQTVQYVGETVFY